MNEEPTPSFEGENENTNDDLDDQSEFEEINVELDPYYDPNYPHLTKWTGDHPRTQEAYMKTLLAKFVMVGDLKVKVPMGFRTKLTPSLDKPAANMTLYRQMIGSLMYLTASRLEIMISICYCARFQANPHEHNMTVVKNIFRYLKRTSSLGIWYPSSSGFFVQEFCNVDLGGCDLDRKSTTG
ncbi:uncharacterized mitochondrial protein AtMg00810-like [Lactuca sativa]|uniref:uncharacterized mitochondrial protein AtMg00810-like n=1 Tax=Lactuca sativa TaxID=4236 RepID=UPI000CD8B544|nr:uncharacterized mitochondrial protein AtMg00810-like [Lactuca sativa]